MGPNDSTAIPNGTAADHPLGYDVTVLAVLR